MMAGYTSWQNGLENLDLRWVRFDPSKRSSPIIRLICRTAITGLWLTLLGNTAQALEPVVASIEKKSAWTGERVPLIVTLHSPGPFSGTATFDLPDLPQTAIIQAGNPVVGSEQVKGESVFTQRHEFSLYTQRAGRFVLPAFQVHFQGKKTFTADPEPMQGSTPELEFQSNRPPETESLGVVIATSNLDVKQTWSLGDQANVNAGDVIERQITQQVEGTTAMMLAPATTTLSDDPRDRDPSANGMRIYVGDPLVEDKSDRGALSARRVDTIKYQFERAGTFNLPDISFSWWDLAANKLRVSTVSGRTIDVAATDRRQDQSTESNPERNDRMLEIMGLIAVGFGVLLYRPVRRQMKTWRARYETGEAIAARRVIAACKANDAKAAYGAILGWKRSAGIDQATEFSADRLGPEWDRLTAHLFAGNQHADSWSGTAFQKAFVATRQAYNDHRPNRSDQSLPALNP